MSRQKGNKTKEVFGAPLRRSEFDDELMRDNMRSHNRLKTQMHYHDRAHRVIMKDLGKESHLLQSKLENDKKDVSLGLYGYKVGTTSSQAPRKYSALSPTGKILSSSSVSTQKTNDSKVDKRLPWDSDPADVETTIKRDSVLSNRSPMHVSKSSERLNNLSARYPSARAQSDDFLATVLNDAMNDELLYTKSLERMSTNVVSQNEPKTTRRRKSKSTTERSSSTSDSIVNALNVRETEPVYQ